MIGRKPSLGRAPPCVVIAVKDVRWWAAGIDDRSAGAKQRKSCDARTDETADGVVSARIGQENHKIPPTEL